MSYDFTAQDIVFFGDSYTDTGRVYDLTGDVLLLPYPFDLLGYQQGFTNGDVWTAPLSELLGTGEANYAIGGADPVSVHVETYGTGKVSDRRLEALIREFFPLTPTGIIEHLKLRRPIYSKTAAYGHFGREEPEFTWEATEEAAELRAAAEQGGAVSLSSTG